MREREGRERVKEREKGREGREAKRERERERGGGGRAGIFSNYHHNLWCTKATSNKGERRRRVKMGTEQWDVGGRVGGGGGGGGGGACGHSTMCKLHASKHPLYAAECAHTHKHTNMHTLTQARKHIL